MDTSRLYEYIDESGSFRARAPERFGPVYFPLANEHGLLSSISPGLEGDIKVDQHRFLTLPLSIEDLHLVRVSRNFWLTFGTGKNSVSWSVSGHSAWQRAITEETELEAGFLWHGITRRNKKLGIEARVLNFVPAIADSFEIMFLEIKNISRKSLHFVPTSAVPLFGRSADNLRDHRHVTALLHRLKKESHGVSLMPTMTFNERGHLINTTSYYMLGADAAGRPPVGFFPTVASFVGNGGDLERPLALIENRRPATRIADADQGKEAMGALRFRPVTLKPGASTTFTLLLGIDNAADKLPDARYTERVRSATGRQNVTALLEATKKFWGETLSTIRFRTGDAEFDRWIRWVQLQPTLRKIFGCSFLPDFDYGRGGRGWRDLWQDCLALLLQNADAVREDILRNFGGVRLDGSNATIIGRKSVPAPADPVPGIRPQARRWIPEFIADRNNITRTWMDHGIWPFLTANLYLQQTGDWDFLLEKMPYFRDALIHRGKKMSQDWAADSNPATRCKVPARGGTAYEGTVLEHILVQTLVPFFHVGEHNIMLLEDADWNDGLDMAHDRGESVAFTCLYGGNMAALASVLETGRDRFGWKEVPVAQELVALLDRTMDAVDYDRIQDKRDRLEHYFESVSGDVSGKVARLPIDDVIRDLKAKSEWIRSHVNKQEWVEAEGHGWFNGYYDNTGTRVEGKNPKSGVRMTLAGQTYPIMAGTAAPERVEKVARAVNEYLFDHELGGLRLNTDFGEIQPNFGRAFSFAYGEKENGSVFSHMAVMYANALYQRGFAAEGDRILNSLHLMARNSKRSRIFPGLPEYFNNEGRGRYAYLTGSASWYVLTLLTQAFGVRGEAGDLLIAPKLEPRQFDKNKEASVSVVFAGRPINVMFRNPSLVPYERLRIRSITDDRGAVAFTARSAREAVILRSTITSRAGGRIIVELEANRK